MRDELFAELTREEAHLAEIERQGAAARARLEACVQSWWPPLLVSLPKLSCRSSRARRNRRRRRQRRCGSFGLCSRGAKGDLEEANSEHVTDGGEVAVGLGSVLCDECPGELDD